MKPLRLVCLVSIWLLFTAVPAQSDIDVGPDPGEPGVMLDGNVIEPAPIQPPGSGTTPIVAPEPVDTVCLEDSLGVVRCLPRTPDDEPVEARPEPTAGDVLRAARTIGLPALQVKVQPGETTLVNVPTVLYAEPQPFERSVTLLGYAVDLVAEPVGYRWLHGDGTDQETSDPGRPYPAMDVTHRYVRPAQDVRARVDVTYKVRYRIDGKAWQMIGQTLTASGPVAELDVAEAAPVLTKR